MYSYISCNVCAYDLQIWSELPKLQCLSNLIISTIIVCFTYFSLLNFQNKWWYIVLNFCNRNIQFIWTTRSDRNWQIELDDKFIFLQIRLKFFKLILIKYDCKDASNPNIRTWSSKTKEGKIWLVNLLSLAEAWDT